MRRVFLSGYSDYMQAYYKYYLTACLDTFFAHFSSMPRNRSRLLLQVIRMEVFLVGKYVGCKIHGKFAFDLFN